MEVLNEGCSLCLLVPAATVSCSSSAYRLCNCYYFFLSLTLFFHSPLCDFFLLVGVYVFNLRLHFNVVNPKRLQNVVDTPRKRLRNVVKLRKCRKYPTKEISKRRKYPKKEITKCRKITKTS